MIERRAAKLLWDAKAASERISRFIINATADRFAGDELLQSAVERQFEIIGEALGALRRQYPGVAAQVPDLSKIVGFRNILIHGYDTVRHDVVWRTIEVDLPPLREALARLLAEAELP